MDMRLPPGLRSALAEQQPPLRLLQRWQPQPAAPLAQATNWRQRLQRLLGR